MRSTPEAARKEPVPVRFFRWNTGFRALRFLLRHREWAFR
jgi:hypothetical protein